MVSINFKPALMLCLLYSDLILASYPRYDMYASLRFKQSYQWYTNSGDEDRGMIHDNLFWMSTNKIIEMKVLCEQFDPSKFDLK